tara:strand:+ start:39558 stop:40346 length:789 start_codon:yes stop_codon:yes gene_type:complete
MKILTLIFLTLTLSAKLTFATGQRSDLIIYKGDTLALLSLPLEEFLGEYDERERKYSILKLTCSTDLWRGYQAFWKLEHNQLSLIDVYLCGNKDKSILKEFFQTQAPSKAIWFTGQLFIQHGKMIKYNHIGFDRYFQEETVVEIEQGNIISEERFVNGIRPDDSGFPNDPDSVIAEVYRRINWENLPELSKEKKLIVSLKTGEIDSLTIIRDKAGEAYIKELQTVLNQFPQLKKFYARGKPLEEAYSFQVIFSNERRRKSNR